MRNRIVKFVKLNIVFFLLVLFLTACGSNTFNGNGKVINISVKDYEKILSEKKPMFLYVKSPFKGDEEEEKFYLEELKKLAKEKNFDLYIFNAKEDMKKKIVKPYSETFAFYNHGELKDELDLDDLPNEKQVIISKIKNFIEYIDDNYSN